MTYYGVLARCSEMVVLICFGRSLLVKVFDFRLVSDELLYLALPSFLPMRVLVSGAIVAELVVVAGLLFGPPLMSYSLALGAVLLALYTAFLSIALVKNLDLVCHCFSRVGERVAPADIARNIVLLIVCGFAYVFGGQSVFGAMPGMAVMLITAITSSLLFINSNLIIGSFKR